MSASDIDSDPGSEVGCDIRSEARSEALTPLARNDNGPVFEEGWQAQVLALAFNLVDRGQFTGTQWSEALGAELASARERGDSDTSLTLSLIHI